MKRITFIMSIFCLLGAAIWADGGSSRPISEEEKTFFQSSYQKTVELLPAAPEGVEKKVEELSIPVNLGVGTEKYPIYFEYYGDYTKTADMSKILKIANDPKGIEEMSEQMSKISEEMEKAIAASDNAKVMELQARMQAVMSGNSSMQQLKGSVDDQKKQSLHFNVSINPNGADYFLYKDIPTPANASYAIRRVKSDSPTRSFSTTDTLLFFGAFNKKLVNETYEIYAPRVEARSTKIHRLIISLQGEAELADEYIAKMNLAGLAALTK